MEKPPPYTKNMQHAVIIGSSLCNDS